MSQIHLVTGGTGVVGAALILELLAQTDAEVLCLVRPKQVSAEQRLWKALDHAAEIYGYDPAIMNGANKRCHAIAGDITLENCRVREKINGKISQFWHSAASLRYQNRYAEEIFATNTHGTRNAVDLAETLDVDCFNYVSTAYVVGKQSGRILERPVKDIETNNVYEQSKIAAEQIIYDLTNIPKRILRPSIVIGNSRTNGILNFLAPTLMDETWVARAVSMIRSPVSAWQALPSYEQAPLQKACRPGFEALAQYGLEW